MLSNPPSTVAEALAGLSIDNEQAFKIRGMGDRGQSVFARHRAAVTRRYATSLIQLR